MRRFACITLIALPVLVGASTNASDEVAAQEKYDFEQKQLQLEHSVLKLRMQIIQSQIDEAGLMLEDIRQQHLRGIKPRAVKPMTSEQCLTDNIYYEAATEPYEGKVAVAQVTMNRVADALGGDTVCAVVYFKKVNPNTGKKEAAFSWTLGSRWRARWVSRQLYAECREIAKQVLAGELQSDIIGRDVEFYHADYIKARWAMNVQPVAKIGHHLFYN